MDVTKFDVDPATLIDAGRRMGIEISLDKIQQMQACLTNLTPQERGDLEEAMKSILAKPCPPIEPTVPHSTQDDLNSSSLGLPLGARVVFQDSSLSEIASGIEADGLSPFPLQSSSVSHQSSHAFHHSIDYHSWLRQASIDEICCPHDSVNAHSTAFQGLREDVSMAFLKRADGSLKRRDLPSDEEIGVIILEKVSAGLAQTRRDIENDHAHRQQAIDKAFMARNEAIQKNRNVRSITHMPGMEGEGDPNSMRKLSVRFSDIRDVVPRKYEKVPQDDPDDEFVNGYDGRSVGDATWFGCLFRCLSLPPGLGL